MKSLGRWHSSHVWQIGLDWIGSSSVLRPRQHSIGYMGDECLTCLAYDVQIYSNSQHILLWKKKSTFQ